MKIVYPIIITNDDDKIPYLVEIPVLSGMTQGTSIENAIEMARDYIGLVIVDRQDNGDTIPKSIYESPKVEQNQITTLVDVDIDKYRQENDTRPVKKTLTIPNYLNTLGIQKKVNFSEILTNGLKEKLNTK